MTASWQRGKGYTEELSVLPAIPIDGGRRAPPPPSPRPASWETRARQVMVTVAVAMAMVLAAGGLLLVAERWGRGNDGVDRHRIERWEDRIDAADATAVQLFAADLTAQQTAALGNRLEHLQRSLCRDLEPHLREVPGDIRDAYVNICEGG